MAYSEVAHKYFLKAFDGQVNKKAYESQILQHNIPNTNILAMQNAILLAKVESAKKKQIAVLTPAAKVAWAYSITNI